MFKTFINRTTVSQIVGDLEKKCQQLVDLSSELRAEAAQKQVDAARLLNERDDHVAEADHADRVAAKVKSLLD